MIYTNRLKNNILQHKKKKRKDKAKTTVERSRLQVLAGNNENIDERD